MNIFYGPHVMERSEGRKGKIDGIEGEEEARRSQRMGNELG